MNSVGNALERQRSHLMAIAGAIGVMLTLGGCGGPSESPDSGGLDGGAQLGPDASLCAQTCDDGLFCNGSERCSPSDPNADENGCITVAANCLGECDEATDSCAADACDTPDADGDGHDRQECGGDDCDDDNPLRYPGNREVCDAEGLDEDCVPSTLGPDSDGDGFIGTECCNFRGDELHCGLDCDPDAATINPSAVETCNGADDNCNGSVDEGVLETYYQDTDGDGFGVLTSTEDACTRPEGFALDPGDCDDVSTPVHPGAAEICDGIDNNCSGVIDDRVDATGAPVACGCTTPGEMRSCGIDVGVCSVGSQTCTGGAWTECNDVGPTTELCDADERDEDCNGISNPSALCECNGSESETCTHLSGLCGQGSRTCNGTGAWGECSILPSAERCDVARLDEDCDASVNEGCQCVGTESETCTHLRGVCGTGSRSCNGSGRWGACSISPRTETCDAARLDEDCDGSRNEGCDCNGTETEAAMRDFCHGTIRCSNGSWGPFEPNGALEWLYRDWDRDGWRDPSTALRRRACGESPAGYTNAGAPTDCEDHNRWSTGTCSLPFAGSTGHHSCLGSSSTRHFYTRIECPNHYDLDSYTSANRSTQRGRYRTVATTYSSSPDNGYVTVNQWCNGLDSSDVFVSGTCVAHRY